MPLNTPFCIEKNRPCPAFEFGLSIASDPVSFETNDVIAIDPKELAPCDACSFTTIGQAALAMLAMSKSGELAAIRDFVPIDELEDTTKPVEYCVGCPQFVDTTEDPNEIIFVNGTPTTKLAYYGQTYFDTLADQDELIRPFALTCHEPVVTKAFETEEGDITREVYCPAALIANFQLSDPEVDTPISINQGIR